MSVRHHLYQPHQPGGKFPPQLARPTLWGAPQTVGGSEFSPSDLGALLLAHYDTSDAANYTITGSGISQLDDLTGNGHHFLQTNDAWRPTLTAGGLGGMDSAHFDGADIEMRCATSPVSAAGFYVWVALSSGNTTADVASLGISKATTTDGWFVFLAGSSGADKVRWYSRVGAYAFAGTSTAYAVNTPHIIKAFEESATSRSVWLDGAAVGTNTTSSAPTGVDEMYLGRANPQPHLLGEIGEVAIVDATGLTAGDIANMDAHFTRWQP